MTKCSVVLMCWNMPKNIESIIKRYNEYSCIEDIIVWNNNPDIFVSNLGLSKVKTINCDCDFGLNTRFICALLLSQRCVIVHDDDLIASEANVKNLIHHFEQDYTRVYTYEGRNLINENYTYEQEGRVENVKEATEATIALTRLTCFDRLYAAEYCKLSDVVFYDTSLNLNGEDIVLSYITSHMSGKKPLVLPLPDPKGYEHLPENPYKISTRSNHLERRNDLANRCEILFPTPRYPELDKNKLMLFGNGFYPIGYYKDSSTVNSDYKKILIKDDSNGVKYLSLSTNNNHYWNIFYINTKIEIKENDCLVIKGFFKDNFIVCDLELEFLIDGKINKTDRIAIPMKEKFASKHLINIKDYINCFENCLLVSINFILHSRKEQPSELCLAELSLESV